MGYRVNSKVFETENEARKFTKDLQALGGLGGWTKTEETPTHYYMGDGRTIPIEEFFTKTYTEATR